MANRPALRLLAMPPSLRTFILESSLVRPHFQLRHHSSNNTADLLAPSIPLSYIPTPSNDPDQRANPSPPPATAALEASTALFTGQSPKFLYAAPRFLHIPMNTHVPEVCILGRSNVGKSTLINALSGKSSSVAGRIHGNASKRAGLAMTSTKAGCTTTLNAYGFGPPPKPTTTTTTTTTTKDSAARAPSGFGLSRSEKRAGRKKKEPPPAHSLVMVDMPGYGLSSKAEWGVEIAKYLARRSMLRGALLLIDAVAGFKDGDRMALGLLRDANVRTTVILTKADKLGYGVDSGGDAGVRKMCLSVWEELRSAERRELTWTEGSGWEPEIWITGAGDPKHGGIGVDGARLAICRMAGLVDDSRKSPAQGLGLAGSGNIVSFDQIQWALASTPDRPRAIL